jgi:hypothetical protein
LEQQQEGVGKLQGYMTNLMAMVAEIGALLGKQPERTPTPLESRR